MSIDTPLLAGAAEHGPWHLFTLCLAGEGAVTPANFWHAWSLAPAVVVPLLLWLAACCRGEAAGGAAPQAESADTARRGWLTAGWLLLVVALVSPLCRLSATLLAAHMVQFMLLAGAAAACLALGRTTPVTARAGASRTRVGRRHAGSGLAVPAAGYGAVIWVWHAPAVYHAILTDPLWHWLGFAVLIASSMLFWVRLVDHHHRGNAGGAVAAVLTTMLHTGLLGALLTFAPRPLYPVLAEGAAAWTLSPLEDQQLAGLIMWVGGGAFFLLVALVLVAVWLQRAGPLTDAA
jgi:cytochrome c oxidase assembly factor CtaG